MAENDPRPDNVIPFRRPKPRPQNTHRPDHGDGGHNVASARRWPPATILFIVAVFVFLCLKAFSPWPVGLMLRHWAAGTGCTSARLVGLAPAHIGNAGYWSHLDPDRTGVSCRTP